MYQGKLRNITMKLLACYTVVILFFMFIAFDRVDKDLSDFAYNFTLSYIPLSFPPRLIDLGNLIAFIPFGLVIPLLFRTGFARFILSFIAIISILELLQMLTRLGSFDINDIILNTIGAAVGFCAQRLIRRNRDTIKGIRVMLLTACILSVGLIAVVDAFNHYMQEGSGQVVAAHHIPSISETAAWDHTLSSFTVDQEKVEPQLNLYTTKNTETKEMTYVLNGNYHEISGNIALVEDGNNTGNEGTRTIIFRADGETVWSIGGETFRDSFRIPLHGANELTIKMVSDYPNTDFIIWDTTLTEVNTGQMIMNRLKEKAKFFISAQ